MSDATTVIVNDDGSTTINLDGAVLMNHVTLYDDDGDPLDDGAGHLKSLLVGTNVDDTTGPIRIHDGSLRVEFRGPDGNSAAVDSDGSVHVNPSLPLFVAGGIAYIFGGTATAYTDGDTIGAPAALTDVPHGLYRMEDIKVTSTTTDLFGTNALEAQFFCKSTAPTGVAADNDPWAIDLTTEVFAGSVRTSYALTVVSDLGGSPQVDCRSLDSPVLAPPLSVTDDLWVLLRGGNGVALGVSGAVLFSLSMTLISDIA